MVLSSEDNAAPVQVKLLDSVATVVLAPEASTNLRRSLPLNPNRTPVSVLGTVRQSTAGTISVLVAPDETSIERR